jgi:hypothetical protein
LKGKIPTVIMVWVGAVQYTFTHKQYTEYRERNTHSNQNILPSNLVSARRAPVVASYTLAFALQLRKKYGKTSVRVAARTSQADSKIHRTKTVTQCTTMPQNNTEH